MSFWWFWSQQPVIEDAVLEDLPRLAEIHAASFPHNWDDEELARMKAQPGVSILVARRASPYGTRTPMGFAVIRSAADEAEVLTIAVDPRRRGRGIGKKLMETACFRLYSARCKSLFLEVDAANEPAVQLYRSLGFKEVARRKGYYRTSDGDGTALVMRLDLG